MADIINTLGIDWAMIIAQMFNFFILLAVLTYLLYKPLFRVIEERQKRISASVDHAQKLEEGMAQLEEERSKRIKEINKQVTELLQQAKKQAENRKREILTQAKGEADQLLEKGRKQIEEERQAMLADIQQTVSTVSVDLATRILEREFSKSDQTRILKKLQKDIPSLIS